MNINEYKNAVVDLFRYGKPTQKQWEEMAAAVLSASETNWDATFHIDSTVLPDDEKPCAWCGYPINECQCDDSIVD